MAGSARRRLVDLLAGNGNAASTSDSASLHLPARTIKVVVDGRPVGLPVNAAEARRLIGSARRARFGLGEETVIDETVRDTWELTPEQVSVKGRGWETQLDRALIILGDRLGLPPGSQLRAELHAMLVYGKGQFFLPHQDSEKHDDMIATLVVSLPSIHTGGELVIDDRGAARRYDGSRDDLVLVLFYADRRHEVKPVRSGHRVTLTFNVMLSAEGFAAPTGTSTKIARLLTEHFMTATAASDGDAPTRLAFLLDHEYTQAGLASGRLKGADDERVAVLRAAAEIAGCDAWLALAEIRETWDTQPTQMPWHDDDADDLDPYDDEGEVVELSSLVEDEITLGWWLRADGGAGETITLALEAGEVCAVTPTYALTPYASQHEGYMGNYGNTVDRWYRRAAVVLWPRAHEFSVRAEAAPTWALEQLADRIAAGDLDRARREARSLEPFWHGLGADLLGPSLELAAALDDEAAASVLLAPFRLDMMTTDDATALAALANTYGAQWQVGLIGMLATAHHWAPVDRGPWIDATLRPLCAALRERGAAPFADALLRTAWEWTSAQVDDRLRDGHDARRRAALTSLGRPLARVLESASADDSARITDHLAADDDRVLEVLVPALRALDPPRAADASVAVARDCVERLERQLARPARATDDWSVRWSGCGCPDCDELAAFLGSRTERSREWPLVTARRRHVHARIEDAGLPVEHVTRRRGRPYTLVLVKSDALHQRETDLRRRAAADLEWITSTFRRSPRTTIGP